VQIVRNYMNFDTCLDNDNFLCSLLVVRLPKIRIHQF